MCRDDSFSYIEELCKKLYHSLTLLFCGMYSDCFTRGLLLESLGQLAGLKRRKLALEMLGKAVQSGLEKRIDDSSSSNESGDTKKRSRDEEASTATAADKKKTTTADDVSEPTAKRAKR